MEATTATRHPYADNGSRVRRARRAIGLTQEEFATKLGLNRRSIIRIENGISLPSPPTRDKIVELTGTDERIDVYDGGRWRDD
jgi:transcriptional regulator with XRE-family HTH domain